jgi:hypothetical protein
VKKWIALKRAVEAVVKNNQISRMLMQREYSGTRMNLKSSVLSNL